MNAEALQTGKIEQQVIQAPRRSDGKIDWRKLRDDPGKLRGFLEQEISGYLADGNVLSFDNLLKAGMSSISGAIARDYPGGLQGIKEHFGVATTKRPIRRPISPEDILRDARDFSEREGGLSETLIREKKRQDLYQRARKHYPGGWMQLQKDLGLTPKRPKTQYYSEEQTRRDALEFFKSEGNISLPLLASKGSSALVARIQRRYPGRIRQLKKDIGMEESRRPRKYWKDPQNIEKEAAEFLAKEGELTSSAVFGKGRADLWAAVERYYPEGWSKLRDKLGVEQPDIKPKGYWDNFGNTEREALEFFRKEGGLTGTLVTAKGRQDLVYGIRRYPGRWIKLREKLGIPEPGSNGISQNEARNELEKLVEVTK